MPISKHDRVTEFGTRTDARNAALLVGAGTCSRAGLPGYAAAANQFRAARLDPNAGDW
jgi:hypothetical protein